MKTTKTKKAMVKKAAKKSPVKLVKPVKKKKK